jgi:hypothetical protein
MPAFGDYPVVMYKHGPPTDWEIRGLRLARASSKHRFIHISSVLASQWVSEESGHFRLEFSGLIGCFFGKMNTVVGVNNTPGMN